MADRDLNRARGCTCFRLRRTARQMTRLYDARLAPAGLTLTQYSLISTLARFFKTPPTVNELAETASMDRTTLTRILKPLIGEGLLELKAGVDRRSKQVVLSTAGQAVFERAKPLWRQAQDEVQAKLGGDRVAELHRLLDESFETLEETI